MKRLAELLRRARLAWSASCLRTRIAQMEALLFRPDLWPADEATAGALYSAHLSELRCELAALDAQA